MSTTVNDGKTGVVARVLAGLDTADSDSDVSRPLGGGMDVSTPTLSYGHVTMEQPSGPSLRVACRTEYQRRLLAVYVACAGWSRPQLAPVWELIEQADAAFLAEDAAGWLGALDALERLVGVSA